MAAAQSPNRAAIASMCARPRSFFCTDSSSGSAPSRCRSAAGSSSMKRLGSRCCVFAPALDLGAVRQVQAFLGAGDADVHQAALFLEPAFVDAGLVRQVAVLAADDEDAAELQALGRMQAHQAHLRCPARRGRRGCSRASCAASSPGLPPSHGLEPVTRVRRGFPCGAGTAASSLHCARSAASRPDSARPAAHQFGRRQRSRGIAQAVHDAA